MDGRAHHGLLQAPHVVDNPLGDGVRGPKLPDGWVERSHNGRQFYVNTTTREKTWVHPAVRLPDGWVERSHNGRPFYVNATTREKTWVHPAVGLGSVQAPPSNPTASNPSPRPSPPSPEGQQLSARRPPATPRQVAPDPMNAERSEASIRDAQLAVLVEYYSTHDKMKTVEQLGVVLDELRAGSDSVSPTAWGALSAAMSVRYGEYLPPLPAPPATHTIVGQVLTELDMDRGDVKGQTQQYVCVQYANVRRYPSLRSAIVARMRPGTIVFVTAQHECDSHYRARVVHTSRNEDAIGGWVSLSIGTKGPKLFEALKGAYSLASYSRSK